MKNDSSDRRWVRQSQVQGSRQFKLVFRDLVWEPRETTVGVDAAAPVLVTSPTCRDRLEILPFRIVSHVLRPSETDSPLDCTFFFDT
jgi:hypothetical protein